ncbi:MAG TPA: potassium channel family protein [Phycisphaerae bacterium]|nr:potassium channel family protein [Phycisphaerae bacterium]
MRILGIIGSLVLILLPLVDAFESILLPRRTTHRFRYARRFFRSTWSFWRALALRMKAGKRRAAFLGVFGPLFLLCLFTTWVLVLIVGFGLLHWSLCTTFNAPEGPATFWTYLYLSGTTFFTLGDGDVAPATSIGRILVVAESGMGFGFLAIIISYLPVLYQAFSHREVRISLLDARAGSPPSASQVLLRLAKSGDPTAVNTCLVEWERWAAAVLESHMSFPLLCFYRSQHDNQSWLAALTAMLDTCTLLLAGVRGHHTYQAQVTFAMARHAVVDLALVFDIAPQVPVADRLTNEQRQQLCASLQDAGAGMHDGADFATKLAELRGMYEPFVNALARYFLLALPPIVPEQVVADNWQRSAWMPRTPGIGDLPKAGTGDDHFH